MSESPVENLSQNERGVIAALINFILHIYLSIHLFVVWCTSHMGRLKRIDEAGAEILLTGTFYSDNWVLAHIRPLARATQCRRIRLVSTHPLTSFENVEVVVPPSWLSSVAGNVGSRLLVFLWLALTTRPHIVGGFHLLFNGLISSLIASIVRVRSIYFCVGGPAEVLDGGLMSENRLFEKIGRADKSLESKLVRAVSYCNIVITMGGGAKRFFESREVRSEIRVVSGGIEVPRVQRANTSNTRYDLLFVGRLVPIKRIDLFIKMVAELREKQIAVNAAIVGNGALYDDLVSQAEQLGVAENIEFAGYQDDVRNWLSQSKLFVLTSDSEGLSLALMEAMSYGLPAIVSDVGDLGDMIDNGENGFLVKERQAGAFAAAASGLLTDDTAYMAASNAAYQKAGRHSVENCTARWEAILGNLTTMGKN
jgi:glycosyltransferase involved in cell wall biosynthesis